MKNIPTVAEVMTPFPHTIGLDQPIRSAREVMRGHNVRHLPVETAGNLVGIISDRDVNFALAMNDKLDVRDIYTPEPYIVPPDARLDKVVNDMARERFDCALVVDNGRLLGLYTTVDACRTLARYLGEQG